MLDAVGQRLIAALLPVVRRRRLLAQHHGRAMGEHMDGRHGPLFISFANRHGVWSLLVFLLLVSPSW